MYNLFLFLVSPNRHGRLDIPVKFQANEPGHYPCQITLRGQDDIRVFKIECTVNQEGSTAELEFSAPVHQNVTQEIPLVSEDCNSVLKSLIYLRYEIHILTFCIAYVE